MFSEVVIPSEIGGMLTAINKWSPNPSTLKWTTTLGGGFIRGPIEQMKRLGYPVSNTITDAFATRIFADCSRRNMFVENNRMLEPTFDALAVVPSYDGSNSQFNTWDQMHFSIAALRDLYVECGIPWAGSLALELVSSYYVNAKVPYLRCEDGDDPRKWYGSGGRIRVAARCVQALVQALQICRKANVEQSIVSKASDLLAKHVSRISTAWPLTAQPKADHLPVPHVEVFMLGHLWEALGMAGHELFVHYEYSSKVAFAIQKVAGRLIAKAELATVDPVWARGTFAYDLAIDANGESSIHEFAFHDKTKRAEGCGGVNQWIYPALDEGPAKEALRANAKTLKLGPLWWIDRIQEVLP